MARLVSKSLFCFYVFSKNVKNSHIVAEKFKSENLKLCHLRKGT